ncbi:related to ketoreductase [Phialocephala subalpina]|uniref:Related to ketoreductase n=1 Tax=Phialocephala subalpina TaxID=576137 RepID=A0A1L7XLI6_9HELO|nr:related to ketoreductase [Phialocephala subalpina]
MSTNITYLITGANRGNNNSGSRIPFEGETDHIDLQNAEAFDSFIKGAGSKIIAVKIVSSDESAAHTAMQHLQAEHGITKLDVVIANAGIAKYFGPASSTPIAEMREHLEINALAPLILFQSTASLLKAALKPKFVVISTKGSTIGGMENEPFPLTAYGTSKAAVNYIVRKIHFENPWLIAFPIHPGRVATNEESIAAKSVMIASISIEQSVVGVITQISEATREETSGTFRSYDGTVIPW